MEVGLHVGIDIMPESKEKGGLEVPQLSGPTLERRSSAFVELLDEETNLQVLLVSLKRCCAATDCNGR